jgi:hypothetical protein
MKSIEVKVTCQECGHKGTFRLTELQLADMLQALSNSQKKQSKVDPGMEQLRNLMDIFGMD